MGTYNVSKIEGWLKDFTSAKDKFTNTYYSDYKNSYIRSCNDSAVIKMRNKLNQHYDRINRINKRIKDVWDDFLYDLKAIDNRLAGGKGSTNDAAVASKLSKLPTLKEYKANLKVRINSASAVVGTVDKIGWSEDRTALENIDYVLDRTEATIAVAGVSVIEGLAVFGEGLMDLCSPIVTEGYCQFNLMFNEEFTEETAEEARQNSRDFVAKEHVKSWFDEGYENSPELKASREKAYGFDTVRAIGNEVGEVVGAIGISALTQGAVNPAVLYGAAKSGNHIEENFQDENNGYLESILKGGAEGIFDGLFFAAGMKGDAVMKSAATAAVKEGGKQTVKKTAILAGKTLFECGCSVAQDGTNIMINAFFADDVITTPDGQTIRFDNFNDKLSYYYEQSGGLEGLMTSMATASLLSFASDVVDVNKIMKNADMDVALKNTNINTSSTKKSMSNANTKNIDVSSSSKKVHADVNTNNMKNKIEGINPKNVEVSSKSAKPKTEANLDSLKKEYNQLLNQSKEPWFVKAKEAGDNGWAWDLNKVGEADNIVKRMQELESTLGIKNTGVPESKIYDYSQAKKEADAMVQKMRNEPIPGFENIDTNSQEYKKAMQEIYSKPSPSGKQYLSKAENPFDKNNVKKVVDLDTTLELNPNEINKAANVTPKIDKSSRDLNLNKIYSDNPEILSKQGMSYEQYAAKNGIEIKNFKTEIDLAVELGDENWYLVNVLKNNANNMTPEQIAVAKSIINKPRSELNSADLLNAAGPFLKEQDLVNLQKIADHPNMANLTLQQKNTLSQFQAAGGCDINYILRGGSSCGSTLDSFYNLEKTMNNASQNIGHSRNISKKVSIVDEIDDIIKENANTVTIKGVAYYDSVGNNIPTNHVLDLIDQYGANSPEVLQSLQDLVGLDMTDAAYNSRTIPPNKITAYSKDYAKGNLEIMIESYISPGCGAYIDTYGGIKNGLGEMLIKRNCKQTIIDSYVDLATNKLVLVTLYS